MLASCRRLDRRALFNHFRESFRLRLSMSTPGPKQRVFAGLAEIAHALGHAHRLELLEHLGQGERNVEELATRTGLTVANTSRHLQLLRRAALVEGRRAWKQVFYRLSGDDVVVGLLHALSRVGERN